MKRVRVSNFEAVLAHVLPEVAPIEPTAKARARLRGSLLARVQAERKSAAQSFFTIRAEEGKWHEVHPGVKLKLLYRDQATQTFLLDIAPDTIVPSHDHPSNEECFVMRGEALVGDVHLRAGDYHFAHQGSRHTGLRSETGALLLIRTGAEGPRI
jgi:quercetin dioxygenase-like cupin family protein